MGIESADGTGGESQGRHVPGSRWLHVSLAPAPHAVQEFAVEREGLKSLGK